jgi:glycosyltransferase involved in cell wall biosynthesis
LKIVIAGKYIINKDVINGVIVHIVNLARYLSNSSDNEIHVVTLGDSNKYLLNKNIHMHIVKRILSGLDTPFDVFSIRRVIIEINPDIVHAQETWLPYSLAVALLSWKYPNLLTMHGSVRQEVYTLRKISLIGYFNGILSIINELIVLKSIKNIIICSPALNDYLDFRQNNIHIIPNGFSEKNRHILNSKCLSEFSSDLIYIGGLRKIKGVDVLISSIPLVKELYPHVKLIIAGNGALIDELKCLTNNLSLDGNIQFVGTIYDDKKYSYIKSSRIVIVPSRYETFGIVLLEAMACGKPIIASDVGGIPFVVNDKENGFLFKNEDHEDLAKKIIQLLNNPKLGEEMGANGVERARKFEWNHISNLTMETYKKIIAEWS